MVTNQAGVARGYFSEETLHAANRRMNGALELLKTPSKAKIAAAIRQVCNA